MKTTLLKSYPTRRINEFIKLALRKLSQDHKEYRATLKKDISFKIKYERSTILWTFVVYGLRIIKKKKRKRKSIRHLARKFHQRRTSIQLSIFPCYCHPRVSLDNHHKWPNNSTPAWRIEYSSRDSGQSTLQLRTISRRVFRANYGFPLTA